MRNNHTFNRLWLTLLTLATVSICSADDTVRPSQKQYLPQPFFVNQNRQYQSAPAVAPVTSYSSAEAPAPRMGSIQAMQSVPLNRYQYAPQPTQSGMYVPQPPQLVQQPYTQVAHYQQSGRTEVTNSYHPQEIWVDANSDSYEGWSLDDAISATLTSDPRLQIGMAEVAQARADYCTSTLFPNPTLEMSAGALPSRRYREMDGGPPDFTVQVEYPIDWFLFAKRKAEMNSARLGVFPSQEEYADLIRQRVTETATEFYDVLEAKALLAVAREDLEILTNIETITRRMVEIGSLSNVELDRVRLDLYKGRQELLEAESELTISRAKLWAQFGRTDRDPAFDIRGNLDAPLTMEPFPLAEALALAQQNRPDIRALQIQINRARADTVVEKRNAYPEVSLSAGRINEYPEVRQPDLATSGWQVGLTATVPLFNRNQGNRAKANAVLVRATHEYRAGVIDLRAEVEEADQNFRTAFKKATTISQEEVSLAIRVRDSIMDSYKRGARPLIEVLDAERSYREIYRNYITSRADYWRAMYVYNATIGR